MGMPRDFAPGADTAEHIRHTINEALSAALQAVPETTTESPTEYGRRLITARRIVQLIPLSQHGHTALDTVSITEECVAAYRHSGDMFMKATHVYITEGHDVTTESLDPSLDTVFEYDPALGSLSKYDIHHRHLSDTWHRTHQSLHGEPASSDMDYLHRMIRKVIVAQHLSPGNSISLLG